jgi:hypothetical protein
MTLPKTPIHNFPLSNSSDQMPATHYGIPAKSSKYPQPGSAAHIITDNREVIAEST